MGWKVRKLDYTREVWLSVDGQQAALELEETLVNEPVVKNQQLLRIINPKSSVMFLACKSVMPNFGVKNAFVCSMFP